MYNFTFCACFLYACHKSFCYLCLLLLAFDSYVTAYKFIILDLQLTNCEKLGTSWQKN